MVARVCSSGGSSADDRCSMREYEVEGRLPSAFSSGSEPSLEISAESRESGSAVPEANVVAARAQSGAACSCDSSIPRPRYEPRLVAVTASEFASSDANRAENPTLTADDDDDELEVEDAFEPLDDEVECVRNDDDDANERTPPPVPMLLVVLVVVVVLPAVGSWKAAANDEPEPVLDEAVELADGCPWKADDVKGDEPIGSGSGSGNREAALDGTPATVPLVNHEAATPRGVRSSTELPKNAASSMVLEPGSTSANRTRGVMTCERMKARR